MDYLLAIFFFLIPVAFFLALVYSAIDEHRKRVGWQSLKTLRQMEAAFRSGSIIDIRDSRRRSATYAMKVFAGDGASIGERQEIAELMSEAITDALNKTDDETANDVHRLLGTLEACEPEWEASILETVLHSKLMPWVRGEAMRRLVRLLGRNSLDILIPLLNDNEVAGYAASSIAKFGKAAATNEVIARLRDLLEGSTDVHTPSLAAEALIALGRAADPALISRADKLFPWTNFAIKLHAAGLDAKDLIKKFEVAGMVDPKKVDVMKASTVNRIQKSLKYGDGYLTTMRILNSTKSVYTFDVEWGPSPDYRQLLYRISNIAPRSLRIGDISVVNEGDVCRSIDFRIGGHAVHIIPKNDGDWTDIEGVLEGINVVLCQNGHPERFACLDTGSQDASVIVGNIEGLSDLVQSLAMPIFPFFDGREPLN